MQRYMTAREAADTLGISITTVYAYVSRGLIRSEAVGSNTRTRRYYREDIEQLKRRQEQRHNPEKVAETALYFGAPLLESGLTLIEDGHYYYRGYDACKLATTHSIEQVASLLWTGDLDRRIPELYTDTAPLLNDKVEAVMDLVDPAPPFERFMTLLPIAALYDDTAYNLRPESITLTGARILRLMATVTTGHPIEGDIATALQQAWHPQDTTTQHLFDMALVLCADHEMNVSTFTARCTASAGSTPYAAITAGLAALQGRKHGGSTARTMAMFREIKGDVQPGLLNRVKRGESLPGFGHRLYPDGDPRAHLLLEKLAEAYPQSDIIMQGHEVSHEAYRLSGEYPNIEFALVIMALALNLPEGAPIALFALGRTVGWIGHIMEQYAANRLIRPRAKYDGVQPRA